jgi:hypothetical protein
MIDYKILLGKFVRHVNELGEDTWPLSDLARSCSDFTDEEWAALISFEDEVDRSTALQREIAELDRLIHGHEEARAANLAGSKVVYGAVKCFDATELARLRDERAEKMMELQNDPLRRNPLNTGSSTPRK